MSLSTTSSTAPENGETATSTLDEKQIRILGNWIKYFNRQARIFTGLTAHIRTLIAELGSRDMSLELGTCSEEELDANIPFLRRLFKVFRRPSYMEFSELSQTILERSQNARDMTIKYKLVAFQYRKSYNELYAECIKKIINKITPMVKLKCPLVTSLDGKEIIRVSHVANSLAGGRVVPKEKMWELWNHVGMRFTLFGEMYQTSSMSIQRTWHTIIDETGQKIRVESYESSDLPDLTAIIFPWVVENWNFMKVPRIVQQEEVVQEL
jgi:hypothetical protein